MRGPLPFVLGLALAVTPAAAQDAVRKPAVAGAFYPDGADALRAAIDAYLVAARPPAAERPMVLVAPHAGYVFSGQIAADAWRQAQPFDYDTIVVLGPNHTEAFDGIALYRGAGFRTPLGVAAIDTALAAALLAEDGDVTWRDSVHAKEHAIEVQLPFAQRLYPEARVLPIVVSTLDPARLARLGETLARLLADRRALIVASTDLSHYPAVADATRLDRATLDAITTLDPEAVRRAVEAAPRSGAAEVVTGACGEGPILVAIAAARALGATRARIVSYANSADSPAGDPKRVVGYGAVAIDAGRTVAAALDGVAVADPAAALTDDDRRELVSYARETIDRFVTTGTAPISRDTTPRLLRRQGAFVTIKKDGELRGCIGRLIPDGPLHWLVGAVALEAAVADPRFGPVRPNELGHLEVEVSLLTTPRQVVSPDDLVPGEDGVVLVKAGKSAVFLPEVARELGWTRDRWLDELSVKAGLEKGAWRDGALLFAFQTEVIREKQ